MFTRIDVIGAGRVAAAVTARLRERGLDLESGDPELVLLCVPDGAIAEVAASLDCEFIVNVQGDEPLIEPSTIDAAI